MSDWEDVCESFGIANDEDALDNLLAIIHRLDPPQAEREQSHREHSVKSKPRKGVAAIADAFGLVGLDVPEVLQELEWAVRFELATGQWLDIRYNHDRDWSNFNFLNKGTVWSSALRTQVRQALQLHLQQHSKPSEMNLWPKTLWKTVVSLSPFSQVSFQVNHMPLATTISATMQASAGRDGSSTSPSQVCRVSFTYTERGQVDMLTSHGDAALVAVVQCALTEAGLAFKNS
jgi:hypothetical protein